MSGARELSRPSVRPCSRKQKQKAYRDAEAYYRKSLELRLGMKVELA